jgi:hypothetical protein
MMAMGRPRSRSATACSIFRPWVVWAQSRLTPIVPEHLLTVAEIREAFDRIVRRYNEKATNRVHGLTPLAKYQRDRSRRPRRGHDLVRAIEPRTVRVRENGIEHTRDGRTQTFHPVIDGSLILLDQAVTYHADPMDRGIFVDSGHRLVSLRPQAARSDVEAAEIARNATAITRAISDGAEVIRQVDAVASVGLRGLEQALEEYERKAEEIRTGEQEEVMPDAGDDPVPLTRAERLARNPWATMDPAAFVRPAEHTEDEE